VAGKRWNLKLCYFQPVHLQKFDTDSFTFLTQHCIRIQACLYIGMQSISGWEAVEPQTISDTSSPIASIFGHNVTFQDPSGSTYIYIRTYNWGGSGEALNLVTYKPVHLRDFNTNCFESLTERCVRIGMCLHIHIHRSPYLARKRWSLKKSIALKF
jgi:hypothetical protein